MRFLALSLNIEVYSDDFNAVEALTLITNLFEVVTAYQWTNAIAIFSSSTDGYVPHQRDSTFILGCEVTRFTLPMMQVTQRILLNGL